MLNPKTSSNVISTSSKGRLSKKMKLVCSLDEENRTAVRMRLLLKIKASLQYDAIKSLKLMVIDLRMI